MYTDGVLKGTISNPELKTGFHFPMVDFEHALDSEVTLEVDKEKRLAREEAKAAELARAEEEKKVELPEEEKESGRPVFNEIEELAPDQIRPDSSELPTP